MREYTIMIVDDEPDILALLEKALNMEGLSNTIKISDGPAAANCGEDRTLSGGLVLDLLCVRAILYAALRVVLLPFARLGFKKHQVS